MAEQPKNESVAVRTIQLPPDTPALDICGVVLRLREVDEDAAGRVLAARAVTVTGGNPCRSESFHRADLREGTS